MCSTRQDLVHIFTLVIFLSLGHSLLPPCLFLFSLHSLLLLYSVSENIKEEDSASQPLTDMHKALPRWLQQSHTAECNSEMNHLPFTVIWKSSSIWRIYIYINITVKERQLDITDHNEKLSLNSSWLWSHPLLLIFLLQKQVRPCMLYSHNHVNVHHMQRVLPVLILAGQD